MAGTRHLGTAGRRTRATADAQPERTPLATRGGVRVWQWPGPPPAPWTLGSGRRCPALVRGLPARLAGPDLVVEASPLLPLARAHLGTTRPSLPTALTSAHIEGGGFSPRNRLTACWGDCGVICQEGAESIRSGPGALPRRPSGAEVGRPRRPPPGLGSWFCPAVWRGAMAASPRD